MRWFVDNYAARVNERPVRVLDVGSYDVNGSYRHLYAKPDYEYMGLDVEAGPNVDIIVARPYEWSELETDAFDIVISGQALEHIEFFWVTMSEMTRVLKKGGLLCLIAPLSQGQHRYPVDCYRLLTDGMVALSRYLTLELLHAHDDCAPSANDMSWHDGNIIDSMLIAKKPYTGEPRIVDLSTYNCEPEDQAAIRDELVPARPRRVRRLLHRKWRGLSRRLQD